MAAGKYNKMKVCTGDSEGEVRRKAGMEEEKLCVCSFVRQYLSGAGRKWTNKYIERKWETFANYTSYSLR